MGAIGREIDSPLINVPILPKTLALCPETRRANQLARRRHVISKKVAVPWACMSGEIMNTGKLTSMKGKGMNLGPSMSGQGGIGRYTEYTFDRNACMST